MTLEKFRIMHSTLVEQYQFIEFHLEGIYASICGKGFCSGLSDVERSNMNQLVQVIKEVEKEKEISVFTNAECDELKNICSRRNFWCHNCYVDMIFDKKTGGPKKTEDINILLEDLRNAEELRDMLYEKVQKFLPEVRCL